MLGGTLRSGLIPQMLDSHLLTCMLTGHSTDLDPRALAFWLCRQNWRQNWPWHGASCTAGAWTSPGKPTLARTGAKPWEMPSAYLQSSGASHVHLTLCTALVPALTRFQPVRCYQQSWEMSAAYRGAQVRRMCAIPCAKPLSLLVSTNATSHPGPAFVPGTRLTVTTCRATCKHAQHR